MFASVNHSQVRSEFERHIQRGRVSLESSLGRSSFMCGPRRIKPPRAFEFSGGADQLNKLGCGMTAVIYFLRLLFAIVNVKSKSEMFFLQNSGVLWRVFLRS